MSGPLKGSEGLSFKILRSHPIYMMSTPLPPHPLSLRLWPQLYAIGQVCLS